MDFERPRPTRKPGTASHAKRSASGDGSRPRPLSAAKVRQELDQLLEEESSRVEARRRDLTRARDLIRFLSSGPSTPSGSGFEELPADLAAATVASLIREAETEILSLVMVTDEGPGMDDVTLRENQERIRSGLTQRTLYPADALRSPASLQWMRTWAAIGEQQRLLPDVDTEFAVFGGKVAISLAVWGDGDSGYVITRDPLLVNLHIAHFDALWAHAQPLTHASADHGGEEQLLELLSHGVKDEAIARLLGLGLRTVRRRIANLMVSHGADTRYQLGLAIGRRQDGAR